MIAGAATSTSAIGFASGTYDGTTYRAGGAASEGVGAAGFTSSVSDGNHDGEAESYNAQNGAENTAEWAYNPASGGNLTVNGANYTLPAFPQ